MSARGIIASSLTALVLLSPCAALADICGANGKPVVYVTGSSASKPFLAVLGRALYNDAQPIALVYKSAGSCIGVSAVLNGDPVTGTAVYWDPASPTMNNEVSCTIGTGTVAGSILADIGISDVFASTCFDLPGGLPSSIGDFFGPVQAMTFVVPKMSTEKSISAAAAYFVFGFGQDSGVAPWNDNTHIFRRNGSSGTQSMIGRLIGVPPAKFKGVDATNSAGVIMSVSTSPSPASTIGILAATDISDAVRLQLNVLAYKHYDQSCGYYPDSAPTAKDKVNVRDGHYAIWGPMHLFSKLDENGYVKNPDARRLVSFATGTIPPPGGVNLIEVEAVNNVIPSCAMQVQRMTEGGPLTPFTPENGCGCYFEQLATGSATDCQTCTRDTECPDGTPKCSFGFCELR